jgi:hypothetical protein
MDGIERRNAVRRDVELKATIEGGSGQPALAAVVRNISDSGARLEGPALPASSDRFDLTITRESGESEKHPARVVWRSEGAVGVNFCDYIGA